MTVHLGYWGLILILIWFAHLGVGAAAVFAAMKVWRARTDKFAFRLMIFLHATMIDALEAILLIFMARGVQLTWKFSITMFAAAAIRDIVRLPLLLLLIKGLKE